MGETGYNRHNSRTWHSEQRCSGTLFQAAEAMDSKVAENRGLSPCGNCADGEWPHDDEDESSDRHPLRWLAKIEPGETALKFTSRGWAGPEYVGRRDGDYIRWPFGDEKKVGKAHREQIIADLADPGIEVETVEWEETPLVGDDDG